MRVGRVKVWVPGVLGHADVVPDGRELGGIELDCSIDAIIGPSVRSSGRGRGAWIKSNSGGDGFRRSRCRAGQTAIVERNTDRVGDAIISDVQIRLEFVHGIDVVVHYEGSGPVGAIVGGGGQIDVRNARSTVLPTHIEWIITIDKVVSYGKGVDYAFAKGGVLIGGNEDVMVYQQRRLPSRAAIARGDHVYISKLEAFLLRIIGFRGVHGSVGRDMREHVTVP